MIIIIEGLDGVGKTTLTKKLSKKYNLNYIKGTFSDNFDEKKERIISLFGQLFSNENYIYDRSTLIDDFVYSFLNDKESDLEQYFDIIKSILNHCKIFHLILDESKREERFINRGDEYVTNDMISKISENYAKFYKRLNCLVYLFPLSNNLDGDIDKIYKLATT